MADPEYVALVQAEIDGELDGRGRAELARRLLADPEARALREDLARLRAMLDTVVDVEPPAQLQARILQALPVPAAARSRLQWAAPRWRYAALIAGVAVTATLVYQSVNGPGPGTAEVVGTIAAGRPPPTLDTVVLGSGPVTGRVSLSRDDAGLTLSFELVASAPVDVLIANGGHALRVNDLGRAPSSGQRTTVSLPQSDSRSPVHMTFLMAGREVGRATLEVPEGL